MNPPDQPTGIIMGHPCGQPLHDLVHRTPAISPTPRTDAAWSKTFWDESLQFWSDNAANKMREECATLERELAAERERVRVLREALSRRHDEQSYHCQYVDDALASTEAAK